MQIEKNPLWRAGKHPLLWGCLLLTAVTVLNNWPMAAFGFAWDDYGYVVRNYPIQDPVSRKSLLWCLTAFAEANWHPMTWLALHLQFQLFGLNPGGYHVTNLLLHIANTLLLYALLYRTTRAVGKSLFVAALFSVHPLHIESVAWISEIKDVLSTFFFLLMLHAYVTYSRRPGLWRYGLVGLLLALGLASKPMLVTAPFVMLLLDYWPLGRWTGGPEAAFPGAAGPRLPARRLILEKLPFFAMVGAVCVLTFLAQREGGAVASLGQTPLLLRLANVANAYVMYVWRMAWPWPLSFFYPLQPIPIWRAALCLIGLGVVSALIYRAHKARPYLVVGWLWYLGTLVPVIGLVQVGSQAIADRYTYIPLIGLFAAVAWFIDDFRNRCRLSFLLPTAVTIAMTLIFMCVSLDYLLNWKNEEDLYSYALRIDKNNMVALNNYGILLIQQDIQKAEEFFKKKLAIDPNSELARLNLGNIALSKKQYLEAIDLLSPTLKSQSERGTVCYLLGQIFNQRHDNEMAEILFRKGIDSKQQQLKTAVALADLLIRQRRYDEALDITTEYLEKTYDKDPHRAFLLWCSARALRLKGERGRARQALDEALRLQTVFPNARRELALLAMDDNDTNAAINILKDSLRRYPSDPNTWALLGQAYARQGQFGRAYVLLHRAFRHEQELDEETAIDGRLTMAALNRKFQQPNTADINSARAHDLRMIISPKNDNILRWRLFQQL